MQDNWDKEQIEKIADVKSPADIDEWKVWLFKENIRLAALEKELSSKKERFEKEREEFIGEMKEWQQKIQYEKTRLEQESKFFDKKFKLLEQGFKQLAADKEKFAADKRAYEYRKQFYRSDDSVSDGNSFAAKTGTTFFFRGIKSQPALKKRYKELLKIFHPDNMGGDNETVGQINKEYAALKEKFGA